jgi:hypothetical protein
LGGDIHLLMSSQLVIHPHREDREADGALLVYVFLVLER